MKLPKKQKLLIGLAAAGIVLVVVFLMLRKTPKTSEDNANNPTPTAVAVPTVDSSVKVALTPSSAGKEVTLDITDIPSGTQSIDYELSYQTSQEGLQGVIGTITLTNETEYQKKITLGTCSSGTCVYHHVVGDIKLTLKFSGSYGEKLFEKSYPVTQQ